MNIRIMKTRGLAALLCCLAPAAGTAFAETLVVNDHVQVRDSGVERPSRGSTMHSVEQRFGQPSQRHATVGGAPLQPPITRWDYPNFSVFFEKDRVIHSVVTGGG